MHMPPLASTEELLRQYVEDEYGAPEGAPAPAFEPWPRNLTASGWQLYAIDLRNRLDDLLASREREDEALTEALDAKWKQKMQDMRVLFGVLAFGLTLAAYLVGSFAR